MTNTANSRPFESHRVTAMALDPIHVGTGGTRLGRVDLSIVRDPVTRLPKIPGSSLAGVHRAYAALAKNRYPRCAGQGQEKPGSGGHCGQMDCPICTVFGFARGQGGGFAGLAGFTDAQLLLFPVPTYRGPHWVTSPETLRAADIEPPTVENDKVHLLEPDGHLNLGWLMLEGTTIGDHARLRGALDNLRVPDCVSKHIAIVSDQLFTHIVNSNLEVRTSVSIDPATGAAEEGALFTYEALPRATILTWQVTCRNPIHFGTGQEQDKAVRTPRDVFEVVAEAQPYLEQLGIGGMGTRGMGRLRVLASADGTNSGPA
ncbi:MAG TPA: type III-B CRISPR module RAMP protein Cmr4 [Planctomycetes bacterium]|nr:type III-B CRISPR module RAMP protein Cmr4 [Planctomycetota bacterium]